jgi:hypothetical protein
MTNWKPLLTGALALIVLEVFVSTSAAGNTAGLLKLPADWAKKLIDPTVPLIGGSSTSSTVPTPAQMGLTGPVTQMPTGPTVAPPIGGSGAIAQTLQDQLKTGAR